MPKHTGGKNLVFIAESKREVHRNNFFQHDDRWDEGRRVTFKEGQAVPRGNGGGRIRKRNQNMYLAPSRLRIIDEDVDMAGGAGPGPSATRYAPYRGQGRRGKRGGRMPPLPNNAYRGMQGHMWHKVTLYNVTRQEKDQLLNALQAALSQALHPVGFSREGSNAVFFLESQGVADEIRRNVRSIPANDGYRVNLHVNRCPPPNLPLNPELQEKIKNVMSRRYNTQTRALDMKNFHRDADLMKDTFVPLTRTNVAAHVLQTIGDHIPEMQALDLSENRLSNLSPFSQLTTKAPNLKILILAKNNLSDLQQLDALSSLPLEELSLDRNPLCNRFKGNNAYVNVVRKRFPSLLRLDGVDLPPPIKFDIEESNKLPPSQGSFFCSKEAKDVALQFLEQYFTIYDSSSRQPLLDAYHANAQFSMSAAYPPIQTVDTNVQLTSYLQESRNLVKVTQEHRRQKLLRETHLNIVSFLSQLPATQHDPTSFVVDVPFSNASLILCCVSGVFKESGTSERYPPIRSFFRTFVLVPHGSGFCIVNEVLFITNATVKQIKCAFKAPDPTPSPSPVPYVQTGESPAAAASSVVSPPLGTVTSPLGAVASPSGVVTSPLGAVVSPSNVPDEATKHQMVLSFSQQSQMNGEWSIKCLQENQWDFNRAAFVFSELRREGKIPPEAFVK